MRARTRNDVIGYVVAAVAAGFLLCGVLVAAADVINPPSTALTEDGTYTVGRDIEPGTYRSTGDSWCYSYSRDESGGFVDNLEGRHFGVSPMTIVVEQTDDTWEHQNCGRWEKV